MLLPTEPSGYRLAQSREMLARAIKCAHGMGGYESSSFRAAVQAFVTVARHSGFGVERVIVALNDVLNVILVPGLTDLERRLLAERLRRWATEDCARSMGGDVAVRSGALGLSRLTELGEDGALAAPGSAATRRASQ